LGAYLRRQRSRLGAPSALPATAHKRARIVYNMRRFGRAYTKKSAEEFTELHRERQERNLPKRAKELGDELKQVETAEAAEAAV
jgi:hypothetical protein